VKEEIKAMGETYLRHDIRRVISAYFNKPLQGITQFTFKSN